MRDFSVEASLLLETQVYPLVEARVLASLKPVFEI